MDDYFGGFVWMIRNIIGGFIVILVGTALLPVFAEPFGLCGWTIDEEPEKPHRQTYLEYV